MMMMHPYMYAGMDEADREEYKIYARRMALTINRQIGQQVASDSMGAVVAEVTLRAGIGMAELYGKSRKRDVVDIRCVCAKALQQLGHGPTAIGRALHRDHTSAIHLVHRADDLLAHNKAFTGLYHLLTKNLL